MGQRQLPEVAHERFGRGRRDYQGCFRDLKKKSIKKTIPSNEFGRLVPVFIGWKDQSVGRLKRRGCDERENQRAKGK